MRIPITGQLRSYIFVAILQDMMVTRSRGRGRVFGSDRGRFFGSATPYRRENGKRIRNLLSNRIQRKLSRSQLVIQSDSTLIFPTSHYLILPNPAQATRNSRMLDYPKV